MTRNQIAELQERVGTEPDGFWGPKSAAACQRYLRRLMPDPHPWPASSRAALVAFYGDPGRDEIARRLVPIDVTGLGVQFGGQGVSWIMVHERCERSLRAVLVELAGGPHAGLLERYAGVYNHRPMRGGSNWSLHAYGAAIDLDPGRNGLNTHWPTRATMPLDVMEVFARAGWLPAGAFWARDAMHFQATR
jgi:hypothetical protein